MLAISGAEGQSRTDTGSPTGFGVLRGLYFPVTNRPK